MKKMILFLLLLATSTNAETYQWVDRAGTVHFSASLAEIPASYRKSAKPLGITVSPTTASPAQNSKQSNKLAPQVTPMKERIMQDQTSMDLIRSLQNDPDMQALLNDPAIVRAVQAGDYGALLNNPALLKLLEKPQVKAIGKRMQ